MIISAGLKISDKTLGLWTPVFSGEFMWSEYWQFEPAARDRAKDDAQKPRHIEQFSDDFRALEAGAIAKRVRQYELDLGPEFPSPVQMFGSMTMTEDEFTRRLKGQIDYIRADLNSWIAGKRTEKMIEAAEVAVGVPLGYLIAGFAIRWILRGFRSSKAG